MMASKHGMLCHKIVTSQQVNVANIEFPAIARDVSKIIRDTKLESLQGLLGEDWERVAHKLAREYWGVT